MKTFTKKNSQLRRLEKRLKRQGEISSSEAQEIGIRHLRAQIHFLRKEGYRIFKSDETYKMI